MTPLRDRILATIAEAEHRLALAEAATPGPWHMCATTIGAGESCGDNPDIGACWGDGDAVRAMDDAAHIAANDPSTVAAEQRRIIAAGHADLALLDSYPSPGNYVYGVRGSALRIIEAASASLNARYPEKEE